MRKPSPPEPPTPNASDPPLVKRKATIYYGGFAFRGGGVLRHAESLRAELERSGWNVELITLESLPLPVRFLPHVVCQVVNLFRAPMGFYYKDRLTRRLYRQYFGDHAQLRIFEDIYLTWNSQVPSVTIIHAVWSDNLQALSIDPAARMRLVRSEECVIDSIAHPMMTVSNEYRDALLTSHADSRVLPTASVVPMGLDLAEFENAGHAEHSPKSLVFCGSLESRKNLHFLLRVFRKLYEADPAHRLTIIGDGPDQANLERHALENALPVVFLGRLGSADVIKELCRHSLYVHPSVKESFSFALLEAKLSGLRTIAHQGLEVPPGFIDVPVTSFEEAEWLAAIRAAERFVSREINAEIYSSRRMMVKTLELAFGDVERGT